MQQHFARLQLFGGRGSALATRVCKSDSFTSWLKAQPAGLVPTPHPYNPAAFLGTAAIGWSVVLGKTSFVYRVPEETPHVFYIVLIERACSRAALHSPFRDLVHLLELVKAARVGITWIRGHVEPTKNRPVDALERDRILAFYRRYLTAVSTGVENGVEWFGGSLETFSWEQEKRKVRAAACGASDVHQTSYPTTHLNR